jgi:hypothetical protein
MAMAASHAYVGGMGNRLLILVLVALAALSGVAAYVGWNLAPDAEVSGHGYAAMAIGIVFSLVVGIALMTLVFYSSRMGYDDDAGRDRHAPPDRELSP